LLGPELELDETWASELGICRKMHITRKELIVWKKENT
jgi:hypothetical protein